MKKVLIISYHFPPDSAVGALRPAKFVKYLPEFGYEPYVITVKDRYYDRINPIRKNISNEVNINGYIPKNVSRTFMLLNPNNIYGLMKKWICRILRREHILEYDKGTFEQKKKQQFVKTEGLSTKIKRLITSILLLPDDKAGWLPFGFLNACRLIKKKNINYVVTTGPPHSTHLIGFMLKKYLKIKWIVDFRDPWWIDYGGKPVWARSLVSDYCEHKMEEKVLKMADKVIFVSERMKEGYARFYPTIDQEKMAVVTNGCDPDQFSSLTSINKFDKFTITYTGSLYHGRTPLQFFVAISELIKEGKVSMNKIDIKLIGHTKFANGESVIEMARKQGIESLVSISDPVPHKKALWFIMRSHVLLLFAPDQYYQIPAKAYEYMASGSNIITFTREGATKDLIDNYEMGISVSPDNITEIRDAVFACYKKYLESNVNEKTKVNNVGTNRDSCINGYDMRTLTRKLTLIMK